MEALVGLSATLQLRINPAKSAVARVWERQFLGFSFWVAPGKAVKRRVAPKALNALKDRVRQITRRSGRRSIGHVVAELRRYLVGWRAYFHLAETPGVFADVQKWLYRRLRALHLKHWKRGRTAYRELRARGVSEPVAGMAARFARTWWRVAGHSALHLALPTEYFDRLGVLRLAVR
jgi:RNA-directed DNA polymerase